MSDERLQMMLAYSFGFVFVVCVLVLIVPDTEPDLAAVRGVPDRVVALSS